MAIKYNRLVEFVSDTNLHRAYAAFRGGYGWYLSINVDKYNLVCMSQARRAMKRIQPGIKGKWRILSAEESQVVLTINS